MYNITCVCVYTACAVKAIVIIGTVHLKIAIHNLSWDVAILAYFYKMN
jgi:hypothetical protein